MLVLSALAEARLGAKLGLGMEMVMEGTDPPASLLFRKEDSVRPRFRKQKQKKYLILPQNKPKLHFLSLESHSCETENLVGPCPFPSPTHLMQRRLCGCSSGERLWVAGRALQHIHGFRREAGAMDQLSQRLDVEKWELKE